jgi:LysR family transcriptional regulator, glycine cleavage system transcriptional activator
MLNAYRTLPPLSGLIGFEAAARLGSFSRAAEELNVTQSAISHQIRLIEDNLGQPLFRRTGRRIDLTDAGRDLATTTTKALETLRQGVRRLAAYTKPGSVILMMSPALAMGWYLPRLGTLRSDLPGIEPWLHTDDNPEVSEDAEIDIVISSVAWTAPGTASEPLLTDRLVPLAAPQVVAGLPEVDEMQRLDRADLLHDESQNDWQKWFGKVGSVRSNLTSGLNFSDSAMMLRAAAAGQGICLGSTVLAADLMSNGALVPAAQTDLQLGTGFHLNAWTRNFARPAVVALWDWLGAAAKTPSNAE